MGDRTLFGLVLLNLGHAALERGDLERAGALLREVLLTSQELGDAQRILLVLVELASAAAATGGRERAARLWGAVEGLSEATGLSIGGLTEPHQLERYRAANRAELGEAAWEEAFAVGRAMTLEEAVSYALEEVDRA